MSLTLIYADTSIWNCLCDQRVDMQALLAALAARNAELVLGENVLTELAKTFLMSSPNSQSRGKELFSYLKPYVFLGIPVLKPTWALLIEETLHVWEKGPTVEPFTSEHHRATLRAAVDELSDGTLGSDARQMILERKKAARNTRTDMGAHLEARPKLVRILRQAPLNRKWLARQAIGFRGRGALVGHLTAEFPSNSPTDLGIVAKKLLAKRRYRISHALARSDVYLNWRCANLGSLRSDIPDDIFHVVNASYCDVFVTTDKDQASYVYHTLDCIKSMLYDNDQSLLSWFPTVG